MNFGLNIWQRGLLLIGAITLLLITYAQSEYDGFDGIGWVVPIALALALSVLALSGRSQAKVVKAKESPSVEVRGADEFPTTTAALMGAFNSAKNLFARNVRLREQKLNLNDPGFLEQSGGNRFKVYTYSFVVVVMSAYRLDPEFLGSERYNQFLRLVLSKLKKAWMDANAISSIELEEHKAAYTNAIVQIPEIQTQVLSRFFDDSRTPFKPLFDFISADSDRDPAELADELEEVTRRIVFEMIGDL